MDIVRTPDILDLVAIRNWPPAYNLRNYTNGFDMFSTKKIKPHALH